MKTKTKKQANVGPIQCVLNELDGLVKSCKDNSLPQFVTDAIVSSMEEIYSNVNIVTEHEDRMRGVLLNMSAIPIIVDNQGNFYSLKGHYSFTPDVKDFTLVEFTVSEPFTASVIKIVDVVTQESPDKASEKANEKSEERDLVYITKFESTPGVEHESYFIASSFSTAEELTAILHKRGLPEEKIIGTSFLSFDYPCSIKDLENFKRISYLRFVHKLELMFHWHKDSYYYTRFNSPLLVLMNIMRETDINNYREHQDYESCSRSIYSMMEKMHMTASKGA